MRERTQEVRVEASEDGGRSYRQILVQEYNSAPKGATYQRRRIALQSPPTPSRPQIYIMECTAEFTQRSLHPPAQHREDFVAKLS
jgi:hypothetical protein